MTIHAACLRTLSPLSVLKHAFEEEMLINGYALKTR